MKEIMNGLMNIRTYAAIISLCATLNALGEAKLRFDVKSDVAVCGIDVRSDIAVKYIVDKSVKGTVVECRAESGTPDMWDIQVHRGRVSLGNADRPANDCEIPRLDVTIRSGNGLESVEVKGISTFEMPKRYASKLPLRISAEGNAQIKCADIEISDRNGISITSAGSSNISIKNLSTGSFVSENGGTSELTIDRIDGTHLKITGMGTSKIKILDADLTSSVIELSGDSSAEIREIDGTGLNLDVAGSSVFRADRFDGTTTGCNLSGVGSVNIRKVDATTFTANLSGGSSFVSEGMDISGCDITMSGTARMEPGRLDATGTNIKISGNSWIHGNTCDVTTFTGSVSGGGEMTWKSVDCTGFQLEATSNSRALIERVDCGEMRVLSENGGNIRLPAVDATNIDVILTKGGYVTIGGKCVGGQLTSDETSQIDASALIPEETLTIKAGGVVSYRAGSKAKKVKNNENVIPMP